VYIVPVMLLASAAKQKTSCMAQISCCGNMWSTSERAAKIVLIISCGGGVGSVSAHESLVGGSGLRQMIFDKCWHEPRDGGKFLTALEGSKECC
jgi:hypothetical protein